MPRHRYALKPPYSHVLKTQHHRVRQPPKQMMSIASKDLYGVPVLLGHNEPIVQLHKVHPLLYDSTTYSKGFSLGTLKAAFV